MVNFFVWKSPSSVNIVDILALRGVSELMWCWRGTASVAAWDLLHSGLWSPNSWSSQDAASESSTPALESWRRLWVRILGCDCQDQEGGHPWRARTRTKQNKSCQNRICANLALSVLCNRYLTLLAKSLSHTSPLGKPSRKKSAVFLNIVQKAFDPPPPPFIWTFVLFCRGCFLNAFLSIKNGSNIQWPEWAPHI